MPNPRLSPLPIIFFPQVKEEKVEQEKNRYKVRPLRDFSSSFEKRQIATEKAKMEAEKKKKEEEAAAKIAVRKTIKL